MAKPNVTNNKLTNKEYSIIPAAAFVTKFSSVASKQLGKVRFDKRAITIVTEFIRAKKPYSAGVNNLERIGVTKKPTPAINIFDEKI